MNPISKIVWKFSANARRKRAKFFREQFLIDENTRILDLGSENGSNIHNVLQGAKYTAENVFIADIERRAVAYGSEKFGFTPVLIEEDANLKYPDKFFDIVFCSSVIEHTTVDKSEVWNYKKSADFKKAAWERQKLFAREIVRLGKQYFVQTPSKTFPVESHTWLPLVGYFPREIFLPILKISNKFWVKSAEPDFNLLGFDEMRKLFPEAEIVRETKYGLTKSLMAIKTNFEKNKT